MRLTYLLRVKLKLRPTRQWHENRLYICSKILNFQRHDRQSRASKVNSEKRDFHHNFNDYSNSMTHNVPDPDFAQACNFGKI